MNQRVRISLGLLAALVVSPLHAQVEETTVGGYELKQGFAGGLCGNLNIPCGWEGAPKHHVHNMKSTHVGGGKAREVLDKIVAQFPEYGWATSDGVVDIRPKNKKGSPLDTMISQLDISSTTANKAPWLICQAAKLKCQWREQSGPRRHFKIISLQLKDVSVLDALNKVVAADGMANWQVEYDDKTGRPIIDIDSWRKGSSLWGK